ncbi:MAG: polymer-forming cytoskeletal protein [bacterium]|nr:polymer-forming cytoskeletal protein [bacterium]
MFNNKDQKVVEELSNSSNIIGKGTSVNGNIETFGNVRIEGKVVGNVTTKSKAVLGHSCNVEGNLLAQNAEIEGHIKGTVECTELLVLKPTAVIDGDIVTNKLVVESGASFNGGCKMGSGNKEIAISSERTERKHKPLLKAE